MVSNASTASAPWEVIPGLSPSRSTLLVDASSTLESYLATVTAKVQAEVQGGAGRRQLLESIAVAYCQSFMHLVQLYSNFLLVTWEWRTLALETSKKPPVQQYASETLCWLSSVANDPTVLRTDTLSTFMECAAGNALETRLCALSSNALDTLSCVLFGQLSISASVFPLQNIHKAWRADDIMENIVSEMGPALAECAAHLERDCFLELMKLFIMKISVWYLFFLKELSNSSKRTLTATDCAHIKQDMKIVSEFVSEGPVAFTDEDLREDLRMFELLECLLTEQGESDAFCRRVEAVYTAAQQTPALAAGLTALLSSVVRLRGEAGAGGEGGGGGGGKEDFAFTKKMINKMKELSAVSLPLSDIRAKHYHLYAVLIIFGGKTSHTKEFLSQFLSSSLQPGAHVDVAPGSTTAAVTTTETKGEAAEERSAANARAARSLYMTFSKLAVSSVFTLKDYPNARPEIRLSYANKTIMTQSLEQVAGSSDSTFSCDEEEMLSFSLPRSVGSASTKQQHTTVTCSLVYQVSLFKKMTIGSVTFPLPVVGESAVVLSAALTPNKVHRMSKVADEMVVSLLLQFSTSK